MGLVYLNIYLLHIYTHNMRKKIKVKPNQRNKRKKRKITNDIDYDLIINMIYECLKG